MDNSKEWPIYNPQSIEPRWQKIWEEMGTYRASESTENPKYYCLDFFPYPSGDGLHVGHCRNYVPTDVLSRYKRMKGYNVLHPMGWDAFGEPAEQYAVAHGVHPRVTTDRNTSNFRRQMRMIGTSYDWSREIDSSKPKFYRWTQWFFLLLYKHGLAYRDTNWQWWCPTCQTTLSSHEVAGGACWRGHSGVNRREIPAWYFRITAYADQLLEGLDSIDWPERIKSIQRNWIGRSEGCEVIFQTPQGRKLTVFTTRPDTVFGVTFLALAPEHPYVLDFTTPENRAEVEGYLAGAFQYSEIERMVEGREFSGVFTGGYVIHPLTGAPIPVLVADYVLPAYGTGAVMGVPAHDQRDFAFAEKLDLPIKVVISPFNYQGERLEKAYLAPGVMIHSNQYDGMDNQAAGQEICRELERRSLGGSKVNYRMRDWLISRQRYWGTPIPIVYCEVCGEQPVPEDQLPVLLPAMNNFQPDGSGRSPLGRNPEFVNTICPMCAGSARRETDTMGGFACSSWYFMRFTSPDETKAPFNTNALRYWMPVDLYVGGAEHAVLHLLYARFWTRVLSDAGLIDFKEPFAKLLNQGQLMGPDGSRMSKSRGNVITPDGVVEAYGADALRIYELFMAPFDQDVGWSTEGINGAWRFLNRIWNLFGEGYAESEHSQGEDIELAKIVHRTIHAVSERIENFRLNTMISVLMEYVNSLSERVRLETWRTETFHQALDILLVLLAPAAPHITEEIWHLTGHQGSIHEQKWPEWNQELARVEMVSIAVQIDGKTRDVIDVYSGSIQDEILEQALQKPKVSQYLAGRPVERVFYVPGKILSLVTGPQGNRDS